MYIYIILYTIRIYIILSIILLSLQLHVRMNHVLSALEALVKLKI